ncbi:probable calcium-binding protein CML35 [Typha angustifolia]|uniref:probable calcium-binding protein CML35 n=1 Tax=Typha angustifolia TaxID=59011 RepID=UPI003C2B285A
MKLIPTLRPPFFGSSSSSSSSKKKNKRPKKNRPVSRTDPSSFASAATSPSSSSESVSTDHLIGSTPRSVLPATRRELEAILRRLTPAEEEVAAMLAEAESVNLEEIAALDVGAADPEEMRGAFEVFDADGDGKISAEELHAMLVKLGDEGCSLDDCRSIISGLDKDGNGFVCFDAFVRMMGMDGCD